MGEREGKRGGWEEEGRGMGARRKNCAHHPREGGAGY